MRIHLLNRLANLIVRFPFMIVLVSAVLAAAGALYAAWGLRLDADTDDLIGRDRPFMAGYRAFQEEFGDLEYIHVIVDSAGDDARARAAVDRLLEELRRIPDLPIVFSAIEPHERLRIAMRAMPLEALQDLSQARGAFPALLSGEGPGRVLADAEQLLNGLATVGAALPREEQERLGASAVLLVSSVASARPDAASRSLLGELVEPPARRYLTSDTGRLYFISILPIKNYQTLAVIEEPLQRIRSAIDLVRSEFPGLEIGLTGKPVLQADEMSTTNRDMMVASVLAFVLVALLFVALMGGIRRPLLVVAAFLCGVGWTQGMATLLVGKLNLLSIVFILVLIGVGADYGVHVVARYREFRHGHDVQGSIRRVMRTAVHGNLVGALTSSAVFLMALFTDFQGLRELGLIAGVGLLLCVMAMTFVLPALLVLADRHHQLGDREPIRPGPPRDPFRFLNAVVRRPGTVLLAAAVLTLLMAPLALNFKYEMNLLHLQAPDLESVVWQRRIADDSASATWFGASIADDLPEVQGIVERAGAHPEIGETRSVLDVIVLPTPERDALRASLHDTPPPPPPEDVQAFSSASVRRTLQALERVRALAAQRPTQAADAQRLAPLAADLQVLARELAMEESAAGGPRPVHESVASTVGRVADSLRQMLEGDALDLRAALPAAVAPQMVSPSGKFLVMLHPSGDVWEFEAMRQFVAALRAVDGDVTGVPITHFESLLDMRGAFYRMTVLALLTVTAIILIDCRRIDLTIITLVPVFVGVLWMVAFMGLLGISFSLANFFAVPILVGLGVDGSIHVIHRYREGGEHRLDLGATRRATIITFVTTIIGFGALAVAHHRGLASLGHVMAIGSIASLVSVVVLLPALLAWRERHRGVAAVPLRDKLERAA